MTTYAQLMAQAEKIMQEAEALRLKERQGVIDQVRELIKTYELTAQDLGFSASSRSRSRGGARKAVPIKYRGPGNATWTGRGRQPNWLTRQIEAGKKREDFAV